MSKPDNATDICNLALDHLNTANVTDIENGTDKISSLCSRWYDNTRMAVLRAHTWNFSMKRVKLPELSTTPTFEYSNQYQLPSDYLRVVMIGEYNQYKNYGIESGKLLLNSGGGTLDFRYVYNNEAVESFDPLFIEAFASKLAMNLAYPITGSNTAVSRIEKMYKDCLAQARSVDGQERPPRRKERSKFKEARRKFGTYGSPYLEE